MTYKDVTLNEIFDFPAINSGITEKFIRQHSGSIPVYGGRKEEKPIGFISDNIENITYFEDCLAWNREGSIGYVFWHNHKFVTNDHQRPMVLKEKYKNFIDLNYVKYVLQEFLLTQGFVWSKTASKEKIKNYSILIPITKNNLFDIEKQHIIAQKYQKIETIKRKAESYRSILLKAQIAIQHNFQTKKTYLTDDNYFTILQNKLGHSESYYRQINTNNHNDIPLYTAKNAPVAYTNLINNKLFTANKECPLISFADDGDGTAGTNIIFHTKDFYNNTSRKVIRILDNDINPEYVYYSLLNMKQKYGFDYKYKCNTENLSNVYIDIPINNHEKFDLIKQQEIARRYKNVENKRKQIIALLKQIEETQVRINI